MPFEMACVACSQASTLTAGGRGVTLDARALGGKRAANLQGANALRRTARTGKLSAHDVERDTQTVESLSPP